jgi:hypothetical protein
MNALTWRRYRRSTVMAQCRIRLSVPVCLALCAIAPLAVVEGLNPKTKAVPLQFTIPLEGIAAGQYDCQVSVLDPSAAKATPSGGRRS